MSVWNQITPRNLYGNSAGITSSSFDLTAAANDTDSRGYLNGTDSTAWLLNASGVPQAQGETASPGGAFFNFYLRNGDGFVVARSYSKYNSGGHADYCPIPIEPGGKIEMQLDNQTGSAIEGHVAFTVVEVEGGGDI